MKNPFLLPLLVLKTRRPSRIAEMRVVCDSFWLRRGYDALTFFGTIVVATPRLATQLTNSHNELWSHEMIHLRQARDTHDSWLCFYLLYIWYYVKALGMNRHVENAAYLLNPFELEAYRHMNDPHYLDTPQCGREWRRYARMTPKERLQLLRRTPAAT